ncbi:hypothetical protein N665_2033s0006 [Sinapis alba]|nr:hypothetical protein N665_2033s0006 [Sinapis alba]
MERNGGTSFNQQEDKLSCHVYLEISQDPISSNNQAMEKAKKLLVQDPKLKKDFKFVHFSDNVNIGITHIESGTIGSPSSQSPGFSLFSINLNSDDGGSNSSQHSIGSKKPKLKLKLAQGNNSSMDTLVLSNEQILNFLKASASTREINFQMEENKFLLINLKSIDDSNTRQFIRSEQARIIQKRTQQQQGETTPNLYGQYFGDLRGLESNLPEY